ncbi:hypothetical protein V8F33_004794 [Rhypophila sp. PSN 637]
MNLCFTAPAFNLERTKNFNIAILYCLPIPMGPMNRTKPFIRTVLHRPCPAIKPRNIKPRDVRKTSLATLNHDVATLVIRFLYEYDPDSVNDLAMVCSALYVWARYVQHQITYINFTRGHALEQLHSISRNGFLPAVRELRVKVADRVKPSVDNIRGPPPKSRQERKQLKRQLEAWNLLCNLIPQMTGLSHLHWIGAVIPDPVLEYLGKNLQTRLHITLHHYTESHHSDAQRHREQLALLENLAANMSGSPNLSSLRISLENNAAVYAGEFIHGPLKQLLLSSPALRSLSINIHEQEWGCVTQDVEPDNCSFGLVNGEGPPNPLQELEITGYAWGVARQPATLAGMEYWQRTLDWSQLRRLVLHNRSAIEYRSIKLAEFLAPHLVALEEIDFRADGDQDDPQVISNFFNLLASRKLTSISLPFLVPPSSTATLAAHAATLRSLTIHPSPLTAQDVTLVRDSLPNLSSFSLVCDREDATESWPDETFSLLASIPRLQHLTIWFDLGPSDAPFKPYLNVSSADEIFSQLRQHGATQLQQLTLHSGFPPRPSKGFLATDLDNWDNRSSFVCKSTQDIHGNSSYQVSCTKLTRAENERLRLDAAVRAGEATNDMLAVIKNKRDANHMEYLVALKGPFTWPERQAWQERIWQERTRGCRTRLMEKLIG